MSDIPESERREFFRIKDRLIVEFRQLDYEESLTLRESLSQSGFLTESLEQVDPRYPSKSPLADDVYARLELMDKKLSMILDLLAKRDGLFHTRYVNVVVSGSGLKYACDTRLDEGCFLELRIGLPVSQGSRIVVLGKVVSCTKAETEGGDEWETAISFVGISEKDRDALVSYIFAKERESLRARHTKT